MLIAFFPNGPRLQNIPHLLIIFKYFSTLPNYCKGPNIHDIHREGGEGGIETCLVFQDSISFKQWICCSLSRMEWWVEGHKIGHFFMDVINIWPVTFSIKILPLWFLPNLTTWLSSPTIRHGRVDETKG